MNYLSFDLDRLLQKNLMYSNNVHTKVEQINTDENISFVNFIYTYENLLYFNEIINKKGVHVIYPSAGMNIIDDTDGYENHLLCSHEERAIYINKQPNSNFTFIPKINEEITIISFDLDYIPEYFSSNFKNNDKLSNNLKSAVCVEDCSKEITITGISHRIKWLKNMMGSNHPLIKKSFKELQNAFKKSNLLPKFNRVVLSY